MAYQMYRITTLGEALQETLNELVGKLIAFYFNDSFFRRSEKLVKNIAGGLPKELIPRIMTVFDKCINHALNNRLRNKMSFKAEKLRAYRFVDNVWTFVLEKMEFNNPAISYVSGPVDRVKMVACDASVQKRVG